MGHLGVVRGLGGLVVVDAVASGDIMNAFPVVCNVVIVYMDIGAPQRLDMLSIYSCYCLISALPYTIVPFRLLSSSVSSDDDIRDDGTMVAREHPIIRQRRLDKHALRLPTT